jgi:choline dehydrogenase-like flavoprotein
VSSTRYAYELQHEKPSLVDPVVNRQNLIVFSGGLVTKLALDETSDIVTARAVCVSFPDGSEHLARLAPGGEVIMSAGTVRTPQLLELSGIGNKDILEKFNISVQLDLPAVGENYEDQ